MPTTTTPHRPSRGRLIALTLAAGVIALFSLGAFATGGALLWADDKRDADGFVNTDRETIDTAGYAVTTGRMDLDLDGVGDVLDDVGSGDVKISADAGGDAGTFIGIARTADVERYLDGAGRAVITDYDGWPSDAVYDERPGDRRPERPGAQSFWVQEAQGQGGQTLTWDVRDGDWTAVVMRADAARGLDASVSGGVEVPDLGGFGFAALGTGLVLLTGAGLLVWGAVRRPRDGGDAAAGATAPVLGRDVSPTV